MRTSTSLWSRVTQQLFGKSPAVSKRSHGRNRIPARQRKFDNLESRAVFDASFGAALSIGSDEVGGHVAFDIASDSAGNSYLTGSFVGTVDFDQTTAHLNDTDILTARGSAANSNSGDIFVAKYAPDNSLIWVTRMGGDTINAGNSDVGRMIAIDAAGSVYVSGKFCGTADFGSTILSSAGSTDGFVAKLNSSGVIQWANRWGTVEQPGAFGDDGYGLDVDAAGNVYAIGTRYNTGIDVYKYNSSGGFVWTKSVETKTSGVSTDLVVSSTGNVYVAGSFSGTVDFDPSSKTNYVLSGPGNSAFVLKLNTDGKFGWVSPFVGLGSGSSAGSSTAQAITLDANDNILVGGYYKNSVDFKPGVGTTTLPTIGGTFITKLNQSGRLVWARALEDANSMFLKGIDVDAAGSVYATGYFQGTADLDPGTGSYLRTSAGSDDIFVVKLSSTGNYVWAETFGGSSSDLGYGISVDINGDVHLAGLFRGTVDFDPDPNSIYNLTTPGTSKGFRLKLRQN